MPETTSRATLNCANDPASRARDALGFHLDPVPGSRSFASRFSRTENCFTNQECSGAFTDSLANWR